MIAKRDQIYNQRELVRNHVQYLNSRDTFIDSSEFVQKSLLETHQINVSKEKIKEVMKKDLGMKYRKIKPVSFHANSPQNIILRQQWTIEFLRLWASGKIFLNIDETWLGMSDFRRMKWQQYGTTNSLSTLVMSPRISMIAGIDTLGNTYVSLT